MFEKKKLNNYPNADIMKGTSVGCSSYADGYCIDHNSSENKNILCDGCASFYCVDI